MVLVHGRLNHHLNHQGRHDLDSFEAEIRSVVDEVSKRVESGNTRMAVTDALLAE